MRWSWEVIMGYPVMQLLHNALCQRANEHRGRPVYLFYHKTLIQSILAGQEGVELCSIEMWQGIKH